MTERTEMLLLIACCSNPTLLSLVNELSVQDQCDAGGLGL